MMLRYATLCAVGILVSLFSHRSSAQDWPKWMGPNGDNSWSTSDTIESFPETGLKVLWRAPVTNGYAGPAVANGKVIVTDFVTDANIKISNFERQEFDGTERVLCLDESSGDVIWKHEYPVRYTISYPSGPRCTPVVDGERVYTLGSEGHLICFNLADGKVVWSKELKDVYKTTSALWGYSAHPLIDGDKLITLAGGEGSHIVALNKNTGEEIWRSLTSVEQGYSPPVIIESAMTRQLIALHPKAVSSLNPETGEEYWSLPYDATSNSVIMSPIKIGNFLYAAGYQNQSLLMELDQEQPGAKEVWRNRADVAISPVNVQPHLDEQTGVLYGMHQNGDLRATQFPDGKLLWATSQPVSKRRVGNGTAFVVRQSGTDRYWLFNESGELILATLTTDGYKEISRSKVLEPTNNAFNRPVLWSMPAFANRHVYLRNDEEIICIDLAQNGDETE